MNDLISRQAAIDAIQDEISKESHRPHQITLLHAKRRIENLLPAQQWIPCLQKEPECTGNYLLFRPHFGGENHGQITVCYWNGEEWCDNYYSDSFRSIPVINGLVWMPLPEPYKEEGDEE